MRHGFGWPLASLRARAVLVSILLTLELAGPGAANADTTRNAGTPATSTSPAEPKKPKATPKGPSVSPGDVVVSGHIPPDVVRRIVRQNYGRFRKCYERGLARKPALAGQVTTLFVIDLEGSVASAANDGSDLPDTEVVECIVKAFKGLPFPRSPEPVTVRYTIVLHPG